MPIEIEQNEDAPEVFVCTLKWTSEPLSKKEEDEDTEPDPLSREALWSWSTGRDRIAIMYDMNRDAIINSAGEFFDPPVERDLPFLIARGVKKVAGVPDWAWDMIDTKNSSDFTVDGRLVEKGRACLADIQLGSWQKSGDTRYREATFEIHIKKPRPIKTGETSAPSPWDLEIIDQGLHELDPILGLKKIVDRDDQPLAQPVLLDGSGAVLADPRLVSTHYYHKFTIRDETDFNNLPLA